MTQTNNLVSKRIHNVKCSLENAEQSFLDNHGLKGELDLMLAEAELKNLRRKKDFPWIWNRRVLAGIIAFMVLLGGFGGWHVARNRYRNRAARPAPTVVQQEIVPSLQVEAKNVPPASQTTLEENQVKIEKQTVTQNKEQQVDISRADLHKLVQSARVELNNSK